jgi:predicted RNA-binding Zn ribbon-like protein
MKPQEAPGQLEILRSFLNTLDLERGVDRLDTARGLGDWLAERLPGVGPAVPSDADRRAAVALRGTLRAVVAGEDPDAPAALDRAAARLPVRLGFGDALTPRLVGTGGGVDAALARLLGIVAVAAIDGTWGRLKMCPAEDCRWVFYDHARNRMGVWCQMAECGNRRKVREHRARRRLEPAP